MWLGSYVAQLSWIQLYAIVSIKMTTLKVICAREIPMLLKLTAADKTDKGKQRERNEDTAYKRIESSENGDRGLFIVADGMGG